MTGLDRDDALGALHRLRDRGFLVQHGARGGAYYVLNPDMIRGSAHGLTDAEIERLVVEAARQGPIRNVDGRKITGLASPAAQAMLRRLTEQGTLMRHGANCGTTYTTAVQPGEEV